MIKIIALALLAGGIVLLIFGINAMHSFNSDVSRFGGAVVAAIGLATLWRSPKHS